MPPIRVIDRHDLSIVNVYANAVRVIDEVNDDNEYCRRIILKDGTSATYPVTKYRVQIVEWVDLW